MRTEGDIEGLLRFLLTAPPHAPNANKDEGNAKQLTHIEKHTILEIDLIFLGIFDEDTGGED